MPSPKSEAVFALARRLDNDSRDEESYSIDEMRKHADAALYLREYGLALLAQERKWNDLRTKGAHIR